MEQTLATIRYFWDNVTLSRYLAASVIALGCDLLIYAIFIGFKVDPSWAGAIGYCVGIVVHWFISIYWVFVGKKKSGAAEQMQKLAFAGSAFLGLAVTVGIIELLSTFGAHALVAKGCAVITSFILVYAIRKWGIFA